jgi:hypothetical protein
VSGVRFKATEVLSRNALTLKPKTQLPFYLKTITPMGLPVIMLEPIDMFAGLILQIFQPAPLFIGQPSIGPVNSFDAMNPALFLLEKPDFSAGQLAGFNPMPNSNFLIFSSFMKNSR